jgi:hypothetical protein
MALQYLKLYCITQNVRMIVNNELESIVTWMARAFFLFGGVGLNPH